MISSLSWFFERIPLLINTVNALNAWSRSQVRMPFCLLWHSSGVHGSSHTWIRAWWRLLYITSFQKVITIISAWISRSQVRIDFFLICNSFSMKGSKIRTWWQPPYFNSLSMMITNSSGHFWWTSVLWLSQTWIIVRKGISRFRDWAGPAAIGKGIILAHIALFDMPFFLMKDWPKLQ